MKNKTKRAIPLIMLTITLISIVAIYYSQADISIWGFNISKKELKSKSTYYELLSPYNEIRNISSKKVKELKSNMTYEEIIIKLGMTKDIGSGLFLAQYIVDDKLILSFSFGNLNDKCSLNGDELLKQAKSF